MSVTTLFQDVTSVFPKTMITVVCGNSIAVQSQFGQTTFAKEIHLANMLCGSAMRFKQITATTRCDKYGIYGYGGQTLPTILSDIETQWFTPLANEGVIPNLVIGNALIENDIVAEQTVAQMKNSIQTWIRTIKNRWPGCRILINTPHPSLSYNTLNRKNAYNSIRSYIISLNNNIDIFSCDIANGYSSDADLSIPRTYSIQGSRSGTTLTVTSVPTGVALEKNSYFYIGASTFYITQFLTGTGGIGTYTVSSSGSETDVSFTLCPFTDNSVHPNAKGSWIIGRLMSEKIKEISTIWERDIKGYSSNLPLSGSISAQSPATGTVSTGVTTSGLAASVGATYSFTAENPGMLVSATNIASTDTNFINNATFNFSAVNINNASQISPFAIFEIISGAENLRMIALQPRVQDSVGFTFYTDLQMYTPDAEIGFSDDSTCGYRNGDILTFVLPPISGNGGEITSVQNYVKFLTKYQGGNIQFRVISQGYYDESPIPKISLKTSNYTFTDADDSISFNSSSNVTGTLPSPVSRAGKEFMINNQNTGIVTLTSSFGNIGGYTSWYLQFQNSSIKVKSDGTNWLVISATKRYNISDTVNSTGATYQNNSLIGASSINIVIQNGTIIQQPFVFNSSTGTLTLPVVLGDKLYIAFTPQ
jgi:hypothetical protein